MRKSLFISPFISVFAASLLVSPSPAQEAPKKPLKSDPAALELMQGALGDVMRVIAPQGQEALPVAVTLKCQKASGLKALEGREIRLALRFPDKLRLEASIEGKEVIVGSVDGDVWVRVPNKKFALQGSQDVPRFSTRPDSVSQTNLKSITPEIAPEQLMLLPALTIVTLTTVDNVEHIQVRPTPEATKALEIPSGTVSIRLGGSGREPDQISYSDENYEIVLDIVRFESGEAVDDSQFAFKPEEGEKVEKVASAHLVKFLSLLVETLTAKIPTLPPATGARKVVATEGKGRLEDWDGTRVLFLKGTPTEMGQQQGRLLSQEVRNVTDRILYGVGVGSSFEKGRWFFGEIEEAQARLQKFMDPRYLEEMDALAEAAGMEKEEIRLANFFPELFHCTGFALLGKATSDGKIYHGRVLDYLRGVGLEQNAVVSVVQPDVGNAWINVGYAGFTGTVTAMNEKQISIGEMGGRGEGNWDGKPMAQLMREVMEKANTIDEAVEIMKKGPRTCEYYYVIADAKAKKAVGIKATPTIFETVWQGQSHPQLPDAVEDTVLLSAGDRYEELVRRVKAGHGKFNADTARDLMTKPVCMSSNIHSVLFCPDTLDVWVANADSQNVASHTRYTQYNLKEMLASSQN